MAWLPVRAGQDHLLQFARRPPIDALAELIWNALDAEADLVDVRIETSSFAEGDTELLHVTEITITDNGHGITPAIANQAFASLGDSWKKTLNGRTINDKRALHGSLGRGRFYAYSLGQRARWSSVSQVGDQFQRVEISGDQARVDGFTVADPVPATEPTGTRLTITVEQGRSLGALLRDDIPIQLAARLAPHLLGNADIIVRVDSQRVDPGPLIEGDPVDIRLDEVDPRHLGEREVPVITIVDWTEEVRTAPGVLLSTQDGVSLIEIEKSAPPGTVRSTGYLRWSGWAELGADLLLTQMQHPEIVDAAIEQLTRHVAERTSEVTATIVATLKEEGSYPYPDVISDPLEETERQMFDLVAVTARAPLKAVNRRQRAMSVQLLQIALQERPESLDEILSQALALSPAERDELADFLRYSSLAAIVGAASEVARRLDLLSTLRHLVYSPDVSDEMREVDQLHPLIRDNVWIFGEEWKLSASELGLTNVLRAAVGDDVALEVDLSRQAGKVQLPDGKRGRVDLLLQRGLIDPDKQFHRLVVELKRPSLHLGDAELTQVKRYARALANNAAAGPTRWKFWIVGSDIKPEVEDELKPQDRAWGHVINAANYDVMATTWGRLIDDAELRFSFYREQLRYNVAQDETVERVRRRHNELLPPEPPPMEGD